MYGSVYNYSNYLCSLEKFFCKVQENKMKIGLQEVYCLEITMVKILRYFLLCSSRQ